jgi:DNA polymerase III epsilon subunit-like protein
MNSSLKSLKTIIHSVLLEGQLEKEKLTIQDIVNKLKNRVLIFFDTETTGFSSKTPYSLITEIGAIAIDTSTGEELGRYSMKSKLTQSVEDRRKKQREEIAAGTRKSNSMTIDDILKMTAYEEGDIPFEEEGKVLAGFSEFVSQYRSLGPIMVAHNARFDMRQINDALKLRHEMPFLPKYSVLDTKVLVEKYLQSLLIGLENLRGTDPEVDRLFNELRSTNRFTSKLGSLGTAFEIETKHWHSAIADTLQLSGILAKILDFFERRGDEPYNIGRDIRSGLAKRLPSGEIEYKKTRQEKGAIKPPVNQP